MASKVEVLNDLEASLKAALDGRQCQIWTALPCIVVDVNLIDLTISAQPTIQGQIQDADGVITYVPLPILNKVPICFSSAGGFMLTMPIIPGDEVLVIFASRCIDSWWQLSGIGVPIEPRMHDLTDGFAIPGPKSVPKAALITSPVSSVNAQLRDLAGTTSLEITPTGQINLTAPGGIGITGPVNITGAVMVTGEVTANGIPLSTHTHPVTTAPGTTGLPTP